MGTEFQGAGGEGLDLGASKYAEDGDEVGSSVTC